MPVGDFSSAMTDEGFTLRVLPFVVFSVAIGKFLRANLLAEIIDATPILNNYNIGISVKTSQKIVVLFLQSASSSH
jgi:hypothetical protein